MTLPVSSDGGLPWGAPWTQLEPNIPILNYLYLTIWQTFTECLPSATAPSEVWDTLVAKTKTLPWWHSLSVSVTPGCFQVLGL